jgi:hypothetical protein
MFHFLKTKIIWLMLLLLKIFQEIALYIVVVAE